MPMPRSFSSITCPVPGLDTAVVTVPVTTWSAPSKAPISGSLATPFCRLNTGGTASPVASRLLSAASVSKDFSAHTATS